MAARPSFLPIALIPEMEAMETEQLDISVRRALVGASPISSALIKGLRTRMKVQEIYAAYGMSETGLTFMGNLTGLEGESSGMVGQVMPHICAKILGKDGRIVRPGEKGELLTTGYSLQKGYYNNESESSEVMTRDNQERIWMCTGDEAMIDEHGYCRVTGRLKDVIIRDVGDDFPRTGSGKYQKHIMQEIGKGIIAAETKA
ncbi:Acyl-CoA synthetase member 2 mitochondrial [Aspergillus hancockii]|nr:Acyl-CoA synthetase member 2 mitochondrial [Aspergillus hancockii]